MAFCVESAVKPQPTNLHVVTQNSLSLILQKEGC